ncbi:unnamed protein product [Rhizophagus irregularis]|nr:unnamed protein product [Rhizophagus irregularis]CAB5391759.1 unnamed protein product [Rhizophagus irregularis]
MLSELLPFTIDTKEIVNMKLNVFSTLLLFSIIMSRINAQYSCPTTNSKVYYECCSQCISYYTSCITTGIDNFNCCSFLCAGCPDHSLVAPGCPP